jgi:hypothetical protein
VIQRRFFPGKRTDIEPARDIDMGLTLTRTCAPARVLDAQGKVLAELGCGEAFTVATCPCAPADIGWLIQPVPVFAYSDPFGEGGPKDQYQFVIPHLGLSDGEDEQGRPIFNERGRMTILQLSDLPYWMDLEDPRTHQSWLFLAAPFGDAAGIRWEHAWQINPPPPTAPEDPSDPYAHTWWAGHETEQVGPYLQVRIKHGYISRSQSFTATLKATAFCGDTEIGDLDLTIQRQRLGEGGPMGLG